MAKVDVLNQDDVNWLRLLAEALREAVGVLGWSDKEAAAHIGIDASEYGRWVRLERPVRVHLVMNVEALARPYAMAFLSRVPGVESVRQFNFRWRA